MVTFTANSVKLPTAAANIIYDIDSYYCYVELKTLARIPTGTKVIMTESKQTELYCISFNYDGTYFNHILCSAEQMALWQLKTEPISGTYSVKTLLSKLGVKNKIDVDSGVSSWILPSLNFKSLLKHLSKYAAGIAPHFYYDLLGQLRMFDLGISYNSNNTTTIKGRVMQDNASIEWFLSTPVNLTVYSYSVDGDSVSNIIHDKNYNFAKAFVNDTTGLATAMAKQAYNNEYNNKKYTLRTIVIDEVLSMGHYLGQTVSVNDTQKGVVSFMRYPIRLNQESVFQSAKIVCPQ